MAMYQPSFPQALALVTKAESALSEGHSIWAIGIHQEAAQILRTRAELEMKAGRSLAADSAVAKLAELSLNSNDRVIDSAFHGAAGAHLFYEHQYKQAIPHLEEDSNSPLSLQRLAAAYEKTGYTSGAKETQKTLANFNDPTVEQALVVPAFRKCLQNSSCNVSVKNASVTTMP